MGREIKVGAENHLELRQAADANQAALTVLEAAFDEEQGQVGGQVVTLDAVVRIAAEHSYHGAADQAASILQAAGRYVVEIGPGRRPVVRRLAGAPPPKSL